MELETPRGLDELLGPEVLTDALGVAVQERNTTWH